MHERDLRRLALESGKTTSRKAKAKSGQHLSARNSATASPHLSTQNSPAHSPRHSPTGSRSASRNGSRQNSSSDDDDLDSDDIASSVASLDIGRFQDFHEAAPDVWQHELAECIEQIIERSRNKRNTSGAREEQLAMYSSILKAQYAAEQVQPKLDELIPALLKCFRAGSSEREAVYALWALAATLVTTGEEAFNEVQQALKVRIQDPSSDVAQATAIHVLGAAAFFGGADVVETEEVMSYLLEIVTSDGEYVNAANSGAVVTAALQEWGFMATQFPNMGGKSEEPISAFEEQLDSSVLGVQMAAGEDIALLFEKSYTPRSDDEDESDSEDEENGDEFEQGAFQRHRWANRYDVYGDEEPGLKSKLQELSRSSARHIGKEKRKDLHKAFTDVLHTVEHPWRGPRFSTALDGEARYYMGHRLFVRDGREVVLAINRWWIYHRYEAIKRILGHGFITHYRANAIVRRALPAALEAPVTF